MRIPHPVRRAANLLALTCLCMALAIGVAAARPHASGPGGGTSGGGPTGNASGGGTTGGTSVGGSTGGVGLGGMLAPRSTRLHPMVAGTRARIVNGVAYAPADAPIQVQRAIWAGDRIRHKPYIYGGGHGVWNDVGYDCSGSVSYVLHAAGLLPVSMDSSQFMTWGRSGLGRWITIYTNPGHAFIEIAGIRFDTSSEGDPHPPPGTGPRWRPLLLDTAGYLARHPAGL